MTTLIKKNEHYAFVSELPVRIVAFYNFEFTRTIFCRFSFCTFLVALDSGFSTPSYGRVRLPKLKGTPLLLMETMVYAQGSKHVLEL